LLPGVVHKFTIQLVSSHTRIKEGETCAVVRLLFEFERSAVIHKLFELVWLTATKLLQRRFDFLFFNIVVLFILRAAR
jgi:hypothetical protein